jgi:hypothetical protein
MTVRRLFSIPEHLNQAQLRGQMEAAYPLLQWRTGDSDNAGKYLIGRHEEGAKISFWLEDDPPALEVVVDRPQADDERSRLEEAVAGLTATLHRLGIALRPL